MNSIQGKQRARSLGSATEEDLLAALQKIDDLIVGYQELRDLSMNGRSRVSTLARKAFFLQCKASRLRARLDSFCETPPWGGLFDGWGMG